MLGSSSIWPSWPLTHAEEGTPRWGRRSLLSCPAHAGFSLGPSAVPGMEGRKVQRPLGHTGPWECGQIKWTHEELVEAGLEGRGGPREGVLALG